MKKILLAIGSALGICQIAAGQFTPGDLFIASSVTDEVRIYDSRTLAFKSSFTHPEFVKSGPFPPYTLGPNGMSFNDRGHLVVAAHEKFVEFSAPGVEFAIYPKQTIEANETLLFDRLGNLYTTTATGGTGQLNQYSAAGYVWTQTISLPPGAGQLTGITFDSDDRLFVASQSDARIHVLQADGSFGVFTWQYAITSANSSSLEGLEISRNGELVAAGGDLTRYNRNTGLALGSFDAPNDTLPVPVRTDNLGYIYVADYENGAGSVSSDIFKFAPDGSCFLTAHDAGLFGPFGISVFGASNSIGLGYCFATGTTPGCPCGNGGLRCEGCTNGSATGSSLEATGSSSVAAGDLILRASGAIPSQPGLFFQGDNAINGGAGTQFGDGLRCAGGNVVRLEVALPDANGSATSTVPIAISGGVTAGDIKRYQWWYRDPMGSPCGFGFNLSNGLEVTWAP